MTRGAAPLLSLRSFAAPHALSVGVLALVTVSLLPSMASGQSLEEAQQAYMDVDYERARNVAQQTLDAGGHGPAETARLHELIASTSALLSDDDAAAVAYRRLLAIEPDAAVDPSVPPHLRTPYLQARGWWGARRARFDASVRLLPSPTRGLRIVVELSDPAEMADTILLRLRAPGQPQFEERRLEAAPQTVLEAAELNVASEVANTAPRFDYTVAVLDGQGNTVLERGTALEPAHVENPLYSTGEDPIGDGGGGGEDVLTSWWFWTIIGVLVAGGAAVGIYFAIPPTVDGRSQVTFGL